MRFAIFFHLWLKKTPKYFHQPEKSQIKWPEKISSKVLFFLKQNEKNSAKKQAVTAYLSQRLLIYVLEFPAFCFNSHLFTGNRKGIERNNMTYETINYDIWNGILWNVQMFPETPTRNTKKPSAVVTLSFAGLGFFFFFLLIFIVQAGSFETSLNKLQRSSARKILSVVPFTGFFEELENKKLKSTKLKFPV